MKDKLISLNALEKEIEHDLDMQDLYLPVHFLEAAECVEEAIVRCKDCVCYRYYGLSEETVSECTINHCENPDGDWFCADGERIE